MIIGQRAAKEKEMEEIKQEIERIKEDAKVFKDKTESGQTQMSSQMIYQAKQINVILDKLNLANRFMTKSEKRYERVKEDLKTLKENLNRFEEADEGMQLNKSAD